MHLLLKNPISKQSCILNARTLKTKVLVQKPKIGLLNFGVQCLVWLGRFQILRQGTLHQKLPVSHQTRYIVLYIINTHPVSMMPNKKRTVQRVGFRKIHGPFRPKITGCQIIGAPVQGSIKLLGVHLCIQVGKLRHGLQTGEHLLGGHHQLEQGRESGDACQHEIQVICEIANSELKVLSLGPVLGKLVHAVAHPVIIRFPVTGFNKIFKSQLHRLKPPCPAGDFVQTHEGECGFTIVINNPELFFDGKIRIVKHMHKAASARIKHGNQALGQLLHQFNVFRGAGQFGVLGQRENTHRIATQLDFIAGVDQKGRLNSTA